MKKLTVLLGFLVLTCTAAAATNKQGTKEEDVEVIEIIGQFTAAQWGKIADQAKMDFYDLFNELNEIEKFRMVCKREKPMGSNIRRSVCEPMYFKTAMQQETINTAANSSRSGLDLSRPLIANDKIVFLTRKDKEEADAHMEKLINEHSDLRKKFEFFAKAKRASEIRKQLAE